MMIVIKNLSQFYHKKNKTLQVINNLSIRIKKNEIVSVIGPSGCGKTTFLRLIAGLIIPSEGTIKINKKIVKKGNKDLSLIFQKPVLLPWRTVRENITLPLEFFDKKNKKSHQYINEIIKIIDLEDFEDSYPNELSGGMQQRVALGRALINNPELILMDEPFGALDDLSRSKLNSELLRIWNKIPTTIIFVTHSISEAVFLSDKIIIFSKRPSSIKKVINIKLPRPRNHLIKETKKFQEYIKFIKNQIE